MLSGVAKELPAVETLAREIAHEFGLTGDEDFQGLYLLIALLYNFVYPTMHDLSVLIKQTSAYLDSLGATAEKVATVGAVQYYPVGGLP